MSLHYHGDNSYFFVNRKDIYKFKENNKNVNFGNTFCLGSISKKFEYVEGEEEVYLKGNKSDF